MNDLKILEYIGFTKLLLPDNSSLNYVINYNIQPIKEDNDSWYLNLGILLEKKKSVNVDLYTTNKGVEKVSIYFKFMLYDFSYGRITLSIGYIQDYKLKDEDFMYIFKGEIRNMKIGKILSKNKR